MRDLDDARREVLAAMRLLPIVETPLDDALGLALAVDVIAAHDIPPFPNSGMDGFAVRAADVSTVPVELAIVGDLRAGYGPDTAVRPGSAVRIMTGAPIPPGADTVVRVEDTEELGDQVRILAVTRLGTAVRAAGGDVPAGAEVMWVGDRLTPARVGVLASLGIDRPQVRRRPVVAIMSTGDEVLDPATAELGPGQIRDANRPVLRAELAEVGADVLDLGIVPDDAVVLREALATAAARADAVVTSGGVSMGTHDLVKQVLAEMGEVGFWQVAMQPAKPFAFGHLDGAPLFGLPGNPVSAMVAFEQFVRPALLSMMGSRWLLRPRVRGMVTSHIRSDPSKVVFARASAVWGDGHWSAHPSDRQQSNMLSAMAEGDCFVVVPVGTAEVPAGGEAVLEMFRWPENREAP